MVPDHFTYYCAFIIFINNFPGSWNWLSLYKAAPSFSGLSLPQRDQNHVPRSKPDRSSKGPSPQPMTFVPLLLQRPAGLPWLMLRSPLLTVRSWNSLVTRKAMSQLVRTQAPLAIPRALRGKISDITSQGMGPQPKAKPVGGRTAKGDGVSPGLNQATETDRPTSQWM